MNRPQGWDTLAAICRGVSRTAWWLLRWHSISATLVVGSVVLLVVDRFLAVMAWLLITMVVLAWWLYAPTSFDRRLLRRLRSGWRRELVYNASWDTALSVCRQKEFMSLLKVRSDGYSDLVEVRLYAPPMAGWAPLMQPLADTFEAYNVTVMETSRDRALLRFRYRDRLADPVEPFLVPLDELDLNEVPIGRTEDGDILRLRVQGTNILIGGCSGSGKSGAIWSLLHSLAYAIEAGIVQIWGCDPKGGMELTKGEPLMVRYSCPDVDRATADEGTYEPMVRFLEDAAVFMLQRAGRLRKTTRKHVATVEDPAVIVVIDELLTFTDHLPDGKLKLRERSKNAIKILLTQGRAAGVTVIGAVQDPHKDTVKMRDLFLQRLALRMTEEEQADMVLGDGARRRGALCDRIGEWEHGVGYFRLNNQRNPTRIRISWVDDDRCDWLAEQFRPEGIEVPKIEPVTAMPEEMPPLDASDEEALAFLRSQEVDI